MQVVVSVPRWSCILCEHGTPQRQSQINQSYRCVNGKHINLVSYKSIHCKTMTVMIFHNAMIWNDTHDIWWWWTDKNPHVCFTIFQPLSVLQFIQVILVLSTNQGSSLRKRDPGGPRATQCSGESEIRQMGAFFLKSLALGFCCV